MFGKNSGWVKLHRSILDWEWYSDMPVRVLFIHLFLIANHKDAEYRGINIKRGQAWTSVKSLSSETGLSEKQIRTALKKLEKTQEIEHQGASKGAMITICKYDTYQRDENTRGEQEGEQRANKGRTKGEQGASKGRQTRIEEEKEEKELKNEKKEKLVATAPHPNSFLNPSNDVQFNSSEDLSSSEASITLEHPKEKERTGGAVDVSTLNVPTQKSKTGGRELADPNAVNSPNPSVNAALNEFILFRRRDLRKPLTKRSLEMMLSKWREEKFSPKEIVEAVNTSIMSGWTGVFPKKSGANPSSTPAAKEKRTSEIDYSEGLPIKKKN